MSADERMTKAERRLGARFRGRPIWYRLQYNIAAGERLRADREQSRPSGEKRAAYARHEVLLESSRLLDASARTLEFTSWPVPASESDRRENRRPDPSTTRRAEVSESFRRLLADSVEPCAALLLAGILEEDRGRVAVEELRVVEISSRRELIELLEGGAELFADQLVNYVLTRDEPLSYRAHYNLACFYARRARLGSAGPESSGPESSEPESARPRSAEPTSTQLALTNLESALMNAPAVDRAGLARWASEDPGLDGVRYGETEGEFRRLLALFLPVDAEKPF